MREYCPLKADCPVPTRIPGRNQFDSYNLCSYEKHGTLDKCSSLQLMECGHPRLYLASMDGDISIGQQDITFCAKCAEEGKYA